MINKVILIGNLTRDPEMKHTARGKAVADFCLAYNHKYRSGEEWKKETHFFDVSTFRHAENCQAYLRKGSQVAVEGALRYRRWEDKEGKVKTKISILAETVQFLSWPKESLTPEKEKGEIPF